MKITDNPYRGIFSEEDKWNTTPPGWQRVQEEYKTDYPEPEHVLYANYEYENYEGDSDVLWTDGKGKYYYVHGGHCSCYGLEDQFDIEEYDTKTVQGMIRIAKIINSQLREKINEEPLNNYYYQKVFSLPPEYLEDLMQPYE